MFFFHADTLGMKKIYLLWFLIPFITACHSLSIKKTGKNSEKPVQKFILDHHYLQSQADWHYIRGEGKSSQGFHQQAIEAFKSALVYRPHSFFLQFRLIDEYFQAKLYLEAFKQCTSLLKKWPDNHALHLKMGKIYEKNLMYNKALVEYSWVLRKKPYHIEALYRKGLLYINKGESALARPFFVTLSQIGKKDLHKIHYLLARINKQEGQVQKFLFHLKKSLYFQPDFLAPAMELFSFYQQGGEREKAISVLEDFYENSGFYPQVSLILFRFYAEKGHWGKAIGYFEPFVSAHPENWMLQAHLAWMWGQKKEYGKAISVLEKIVATYPRVSSHIYTLYASLFERKKNFSKALEILSQASKIFPENVDILFYKGFVYDQSGQTDQAIKWMKAVLKIDTNHVEALNHLAFVYAEINENLESAEKMVVKALSLSPNDSYILDTAGWVFFKRGKTEKALEYLKRAYQSKPAEGLIAEHLAEVYYHLNMIDKSISLYKKAIGLEADENRRKKLEKKLLYIQSAV